MFKHYHWVIAALVASATASAELRDPTLPGNLPPSQISDMPGGETALKLSAIWIYDHDRRATINGITVTADQSLSDDTRILKIQPHSVLVRQHGVNKKLTLVPSVKKPVK